MSRKTFAAIVSRIEALYRNDAQPKLIRRRALEVLVRDPRPWHAGAIRKHFASDDADWKLTASLRWDTYAASSAKFSRS